MTKRVIEHEIKLEKSLKIILAVFAFGILVHAFQPTFGIKEALAEWSNDGALGNRLTIDHNLTCTGCS